jgi:hypothetical protein
MVICLQVNSHVEGLLPQIRKIGNLIQPLVVGEQGEVALLGYDSRIRTLQDFTSDGGKITQAVKDIYLGSTQNRMIDAVMTAAQMLGRYLSTAGALFSSLAKRATAPAKTACAKSSWRWN